MSEGFHFLSPQWFWLLLPLLALLWLLRDTGSRGSAWQRVCDPELLPFLLIHRAGHSSRLPVWLLAAGWLLAVLALADPVWEKQPQPVFRSQDARVVVLDLSRSMLAADLPPSRLERARYKVADILSQSREGQTGLVVFAGDAFVVAPLTSDTDTIQALLPPLEPALMPVQGSRVDLALQLAGDLLRQAGLGRGEVLLVTDGFTDTEALDVARELDAGGYRVSVLGVGTGDGAPLPDGRGGYLRDAQGEIVVPGLEPSALRALAAAGGGRYAGISNDSADIDQLQVNNAPLPGAAVEDTGMSTDIWQSRGPWLVLLLLPLAALMFRRGWLLVLVALIGTGAASPPPAIALGWDDLWLRADQQASQALQGGEPEQAAQLAQDPLLRGTAEYQAGAYQQAVDAFAGASGADAHYNQGNALAQLGRYEDAIAAYDRALGEQPAMADAEHNKALLEQLLQQQEQQQQDQQQKQHEEEQDQQQQQQEQQEEQQEEKQSGQQSGADNQQQQDAEQSGQQGQADEQNGQQAASGGGTEQDEPRSEAAPEDQAAEQDEQPPTETGAGAQPEQEQQAQPGEDESRSAASQPEAAEKEPAGAVADSTAEPATLDSEEQQALEQWLRRIPDDPGGLLRRKFLYQYRQRAADTAGSEQQAW
jgi:Ca-activated chloride channel family protein